MSAGTPRPSPWPARARAAAFECAAFGFFLLLAALSTRPLALDLRGATLRGPDPLIDLWTLHWLTTHALEPARLFGGNVFAPFPHAALHSDLSAGTAVLMLPLRAFISDAVPLYNLGVLVALAFSGWGFHALARALTDSRAAGLVCGVLAGFSSHQLHHVYHLNLLGTGWLALFLLGLRRLLERPGPGAALGCGLSFALTALSSGYYAVAAALLGLLFLAWHARGFSRAALGWSAAAALLAAVLLVPYLRGYAALRDQAPLRRPPGVSQRMAFQPARDLGSRSYVDAALVGQGAPGGERLFPGLLTLALAGIALRRRPTPVGFHAAGCLLLLVLSLGPRIEAFGASVPLPYAWLASVPPFDSMRHPYTFAAVALMLLALLAAQGAAALAWTRRRVASALLVGLAVVTTLGPPVGVRAVPAGLPPAYAALLTLPPGITLELPVSHPETMLWAARHGRPVANGNGAFSPSETLRLQHQVTLSWLARAPEDIDGSEPVRLMREVFGVRYVILPGARPVYRRLARAFDASRSFGLIAAYADGSRLYQLVAAPAASP